jgi:type IV pilus assembly protein PilX
MIGRSADRTPQRGATPQRGMVLVTALLMLVVVTLLAIAMFRSFGLDEKIAGNMREKHRAVNAAEDAEQYGEWWLAQGNGTNGVACNTVLNANIGQGQVCQTTSVPASFTALPWLVGGVPAGITYAPPTMNITGTAGGQNSYYLTPQFYITYLGPTPGIQGSIYQIDAVGYGGSPDTAAVIESTYEVVTNVGCPSCQP